METTTSVFTKPELSDSCAPSVTAVTMPAVLSGTKGKWVYRFGAGTAEGDMSMKDLLGGKGAGLHHMARLGLRVPIGFTLTTEACALFTAACNASVKGRPLQELESALPHQLWDQVEDALVWLEREAGAHLGTVTAVPHAAQSSGQLTTEASSETRTAAMPSLLVSVRSGAAVSMPGMMDTVLNLGIATPGVVQAVGDAMGPTGERFALDCMRRHVDMFGCIVMGMKHEAFEAALVDAKRTQLASQGATFTEADVEALPDTALTAQSLRSLVDAYLSLYAHHAGGPFPTDPRKAMRMAILAVFRSWSNPRAVAYRSIHHITKLQGTAVTVQLQVFGNMGDDSGSGVLFTRNPSTGADELFGEYLSNAQGEDVVAGIRTPMPISSLKDRMPAAYTELYKAVKLLENGLGDMQDVEFTVQRGVVYILQCRNGKRTGTAALRIALSMVRAPGSVVTKEQALTRLITPDHMNQLLHKRFVNEEDEVYKGAVCGKGIAASPGAAVGTIVFDPEDAVKAFAEGKPVILVRPETSAEDVAGMHVAEAILTSHGGMTSHAAVVARGWGKPCVCGAGFMHLDLHRPDPMLTVILTSGQAHTCDPTLCKPSEGVHAVCLRTGDWLSVNGTTGEVLLGQHERTEAVLGEDFYTLLDWAVTSAKGGGFQVRANADSGSDCQIARKFGAAGVGLCRTEHMFWGPERITHMRAVILAPTLEARVRALDALFPFQKSDFLDLFMGVGQDGQPTGASPTSARAFPVTVRLLDPPLHEYLPNLDTPAGAAEADKVAFTLGMSPARLYSIIRGMREANPMLGHRGCRVELTHPEIPRLQTRAVITAAAEALAAGIPVEPQIMIPLISCEREMSLLRALVAAEVAATLDFVCPKLGVPRFTVKIGNMLETPRAALVAESIAHSADFFSFGTNDLTALTFGFSRDDAPKFIPAYLDQGVLTDDPFQSLDIDGVGQLITMSVEGGKKGNPRLEVGVCGEVGGDERSVAFFAEAGVDYVSVSPYRVPAAWLAAAQAVLRRKARVTTGAHDATA